MRVEDPFDTSNEWNLFETTVFTVSSGLTKQNHATYDFDAEVPETINLNNDVFVLTNPVYNTFK